MAAKKNNRSNDKTTTATNRKKIWEQLPPEIWLRVASEFKSSHQFTSAGSNRVKGKCVFPGHADTNPSFYINTEAHYASCYGCNKHVNDPIEIMQYLIGTDKIGAINYLRNKLSITVLNKKAEEELEAQQQDQLMKREVATITHNYLCDAVAYINEERNAYAKPLLDWLINARKIDKSIIHLLPIGILPPIAIIASTSRKRYSTKYESFKKDRSGLEEPTDVSQLIVTYLSELSVHTDLIGSLVLPLHSSISEICRFKIRTLSNGSDKNFRITDNNFGDTVGLFGLGWESYLPYFVGKNKIDEAFVTEGEFDVLSVMAKAALNNIKPKIPLISAGGSGGAKDIEPVLRSAGIDKVYLIPDSPAKQGDTVGFEWCRNIRKLHVKVFDGWDKLPGIKDNEGDETGHDIDSAIAYYGEPQVISIIGDTQTPNYLNPSRWVFERATTAIDASPEDSLRARIETAANFGRNVRNRLDRQEYVDLIAKHYDINGPQLARELSAREETESGFIQQCADAIVRKFFIVGHKLIANKRSIVLFSRKKKTQHDLTLGSEDAIARELAPICGTIMSFIERYVGFPSFIENPKETDTTIYKAVDAKLRMYMREALLSLTEGAPDMFGTRFRQGYHVHKKNTDNPVEYIVCGQNILKIERKSNDPTKPKYTQLEGPSDAENGVVFDTLDIENRNASSWYTENITSEILTDPKIDGMSLKDLYEDLCAYFNTGFKYARQEVDHKIAALQTMVMVISNVFRRPPYMFISGDSRSGKSTFLSILSGQKNLPIRLLFASHVADTATFAGVTRMSDRNTLALFLDEFEASDTPAKEKHVNATLEVFRPLVNGIATRTLSTPQGGGLKDQIFEQPTIYSGITAPTKTQDANRMLNIELKCAPAHKTPIESLIPQKFSKEKITSIRKRLNLGMYQYATVLAGLQDHIADELFELQKTMPSYMDSRLASAFIAPLTIVKLALDGMDSDIEWKKFITDYIMAHASDIEQTAQTSESESLVASMFRNPFIRQEDGSEVSIAYLLANSELRSDINKPATGCFYDSSQKLLLILIDVAITKLLTAENRKYGRTVHQLKSAVDRHPKALSYDEIEKSGILLKTGPTLGAGIRAKDVCVLRVIDWMEINRNKPKNEEGKVKESAINTSKEDALYTSIEIKLAVNEDINAKDPMIDDEGSDEPPLMPD